ncbi:ubiquitin-protein ligase [Lithospermum erythrorhizon]|uniref:RING-type E3 ubiquitin transferase n=1 Tax=Lithospermum erythrorhizon TaxID=34254 RepID=A0AAV3PVH7_LITER
MKLTSVSCLTNSISRFIHLATCCAAKIPSQSVFKIMASCLKQLKPLLDNVLDNKIPTDDTVCNVCEELDMAVNEAREFLEKWSPKMSTILCVLQSEQLLFTIQSSSRKITYTLHELLEAPSTSNLPFPQRHMQEFQSSKPENVSKLIEEALACQSRGKVPHAEHLCAIVESLALTSKYELLNEHIAVEKERVKAKNNNLKRASDTLDNIIDLISNIRDYMSKCGNLNVFKGMQIPSYFQCPLSLELMVDPVIVASGQTYDRTSIQKWLDSGLILCPQTHQRLTHTNLIPNYTVKALIVNWCEENGIKLPDPHGSPDNTSVLSLPADFGQVNSKCSLQSNSSTLEVPCQSEKGCEKENVSLESGVSELNIQPEKESVRVAHSSPEHSYSHSRTESTSSAVSSIDYIPGGSTDVSRISSKHDSASDASGEITSDSQTSVNKHLEYSPSSARHHQSSKTLNEVAVNGKHNLSRGFSFKSESSSNDLTTTSHVEEVVKELTSQTTELQTSAAAELRFLAKNNMENRLIIGQCGAIAPLISLLYSDVKITQEHAVTALLNLSICEKIKAMIGQEGAIEPLIYVLRTGNAGARENAAAAVFSLSLLEEYRIKIGRTGAVKALVELLGSGSMRGKKDAATALFNLSIYHENKARIIQAGAVKHLVHLLDPAKEMVDKAIAVLANLSTISEGCLAIAREGGIPALVEIVETGSARGKENAATTLLQMCMNSPKYCKLILQEGAVPPLVALSQSGTPRAKEKAQQLLSHFRNQREGSAVRGGKS